MSDRIEISLDVDILAGIAFWVDRDLWNLMTNEEKRARIGSVIDSIAAQLVNDRIEFEAGSLSAEIIGPDNDKIVLGQVRAYDPDD